MSRISTALAGLGGRVLRTRWMVRAPIACYSAGVGFVFGTRLMMLEHVGRASGARRFVVLEVVERVDRDTYVIVSGFGERAQWYRNVRANARVRVSCGLRRSVPAVAVPMTADESMAALHRYARAHPRAWANLRAMIESAVGHPVESVPMVSVQVSR